jgi:Sugar-transfer associated ATP-grasp
MRDAGLSESAAPERVAPVAPTVSQEAERRSVAEPLPLGTRARRLQRKVLLADHSIEGLYRLVDQFAIRPLLSVLRIVPLLIRVGPAARRDCSVSIRRQIVELLRLILVHGAKPGVYYMTELYRSGAMRDAGALVMRNETKHGLFKALNRIDPEARDRGRTLGDKLGVAQWCAEAGIPHPQPMLAFERGEAVWLGRSLDDLDRDLFVKRRRGKGANGAATYRRTAPFEYLDEDNRPTNLAQIIIELARRSRHDRLLVQPLLRNHPAIADLADEALITFRLWTCLDENLQPVLTNAYLRSMAKLEPKWDVGRLEEFAAPIDLETGTLGQITGDKPECLSEWFDRHPVTGAMVTGRAIPFWPELAALGVKAHTLVPERVMIGWDMAMTAEGPVLLEGNSFADVLYPQRIYRTPLGHMRLGELLNFHLGRLEAKLDERATK